MAAPPEDISVSVGEIDDGFSVKLAGRQRELNLLLRKEELGRLEGVESANWDQRASVRLGTCLEKPVFWCASEDGGVTILVGDDDEIWEVALTISGATVEAIRRELEAEGAELGR